MTETTTETIPQESTLETAQRVMKRLPARRWRVIQIRFDATVSELSADPIAMLIITAHETWRAQRVAESGGLPVRDDWDRFEDMSMEELADCVGAPEDGADAIKSDGDD